MTNADIFSGDFRDEADKPGARAINALLRRLKSGAMAALARPSGLGTEWAPSPQRRAAQNIALLSTPLVENRLTQGAASENAFSIKLVILKKSSMFKALEFTPGNLANPARRGRVGLSLPLQNLVFRRRQWAAAEPSRKSLTVAGRGDVVQKCDRAARPPATLFEMIVSD